MGPAHFPGSIEQRVKQFAKQRHLSHEEAMLLLIESGLQHLTQTQPRSRPERGPQTPTHCNEPERVIGLFADHPDVVDSILEVVKERSERYSDRR